MTDHTPDWHCYQRGCRRTDCREAWRAYAAAHRRAQAYGRKPKCVMIDAAPTLRLVDDLIRAGHSEALITRSSRVGSSTIWRARKTGRIRSDVAARIRRFDTDTADLRPRCRVDGTGTRRRLQALHAIGWTYSAIAIELGCTTQNVRSLVHATESAHGLVTASTAARVRDLYDRSWQTPPAPANAKSAAEQQKAIRRARVNGWAVPVAWDDDTIDDPMVHPGVTPIGSRKQASTVTADDVQWLLELDPWATRRQVAERLGMTLRALEFALERAGRDDLRQQLTRNAQVAS